MKIRKLAIGSLVLASLTVASRAVTTTYNDRNTWEIDVANWLNVNLASQIDEFAILAAGDPIDIGNGKTVSFDQDLEGRQVPNSYTSWSNGNTPRVLLTDITTLEITGTFSSAVGSFGVEAQPDVQDVFKMTLKLDDGSILEQTVDGNGGAQFFGWLTDSGANVVSMTLSIDATPGDEGFAFGRMVHGTNSAVPDAASTGALLLLGLAGLGSARRLFLSR